MLAQVLMPDRQCATCGPDLQRKRGCNAPPQQPLEFDGRVMNRCPMRPFRDEPEAYNAAFQLYRWYRQGYLPDPGTILDQAEAFVSAVSTIDAALQDGERAKRDMDRRKESAARKAKEAAARQPTRRRGGSR